MKLTERIKAKIKNKITLNMLVIYLIEGISLIANLIAVISFFGAKNTPKTSPVFYVNNQEFLAWSTVAVIYTLGIILARMKRRWREKNPQPYDQTKQRTVDWANVSSEVDRQKAEIALQNTYKNKTFIRNFSFTLVLSFPIVFLYTRAIQTSLVADTSLFASPWTSLMLTFAFCLPITFAGMLIAEIFDKALALYQGD